MEIHEITQFIKSKWQTMLVCVIGFIGLALLFSLVQPVKYRSEQRFLIVQEYAEDVDPYAVSRSTEQLTNLFSQVMHSQKFFNSVIANGVDSALFPTEEKKRQKKWQKTLRANSVGDTGLLEVTVYQRDRFQADHIARAVANVLVEQNGQYHSRGESVSIEVIDGPITSVRPVQPNIPLNVAVGAILGLIFSLAFIYLFPKKEFDVVPKFVDQPLHLAGIDHMYQQPSPAGQAPWMYEVADLKHPRKTKSIEAIDIGFIA